MTVEWAPREPEPTGHNTLNYTEQGDEVTHIGGALVFEEGAEVEGLPLPFTPAAGQEESTATTVTALKEEFNALLVKLKAAGLMHEIEK